MPIPGKAWQHIIFNTRSSWLTGDPRGFRSRNHRKHSGGDYRTPPPTGQHAGLFRVVRDGSRPTVKLPKRLWACIGQAVLSKCDEQGHRVLVIAIDHLHVHVLVELPSDREKVKQIAGSWKQRASHAVRDELPGSIWSKSCDPVVISDESHHRRAYQYILDHAKQGAWVWSFRDGEGS
ncbi:MAG: hypothetical protein AAGI37_08025 [Planctomycetota bacterium]